MSPTERQRQKRLDAAFGSWVRERLAAKKPDKWTQQRLAEELVQRGVQVTREWVNQVINGEHAGDDLRDAIELVLGRFHEPADIEPVSANLAEAISELAVAVRQERRARVEWERGFLVAMRELARGVELPGDHERAPRAGAQR